MRYLYILLIFCLDLSYGYLQYLIFDILSILLVLKISTVIRPIFMVRGVVDDLRFAPRSTDAMFRGEGRSTVNPTVKIYNF